MPKSSRSTTPAVPPVGIGWRHPHYAVLLEQQPALDFIEVHSENFFAEGGAALAVLRAGRDQYPVSLHGVGLSLGSACGIDAWHLDQLARLVERIDPVRVSDHASFARIVPSASTAHTDALHAADLLPLPLSNSALDTLCRNVTQVQERLRRPIAVENLSAYVRWRDAQWDEPAFLSALARRTGCHLLVDVNNLYVNALNDARHFGGSADPLQACQRWIDAIDPEHVAEIHLAGHHDGGGLVIDDHGSRVIEPVWRLYRHAIERYGPVPSLIEWDTDLPTLDVLLDEAARARHIGSAALAARGRTASPALEAEP
ncbi:DUF692 domain-containing protein [Tibeticola sp.]|uniref:DUF692 domain-containing protein n=1 Tax=Tibeticola sp. TaxID=2005368 RepID=UPI002586A46B|nr:DUF692 domain-containing protein [Tibeticola sp.]MCI4440243.1 DUF692 domain-containing protein [Tibeticola sp.]